MISHFLETYFFSLVRRLHVMYLYNGEFSINMHKMEHTTKMHLTVPRDITEEEEIKHDS